MNYIKLLLSFILIAILSDCYLFNASPINVVGTWTWEAATDKEGKDLLIDHQFHTLEFKNNLTYTYSIDTFLFEGVYKVDEGSNIIRFDYNKVWEILKSSETQLWLRNLTNENHEWHLKK